MDLHREVHLGAGESLQVTHHLLEELAHLQARAYRFELQGAGEGRALWRRLRGWWIDASPWLANAVGGVGVGRARTRSGGSANPKARTSALAAAGSYARGRIDGLRTLLRLELRLGHLVLDDQHPHGGGALDLPLGLEADEAPAGLIEAFSQIEGAVACKCGLGVGEAFEDHVVGTHSGQVEVLPAPSHELLNGDGLTVLPEEVVEIPADTAGTQSLVQSLLLLALA